MSSRNSDKNKDVIKELEKTISPILVVNNSSLKPYVELFEYAPENIYQQPLGSLVGFFEVKEFSDESAYVVNFLTSVLKKEYYINPKRPVTESLDSALHKVNMALSELAKHGNVEWLGKINAAICVLEKSNAHFSVSGDAKIFLYRNTGLSEISEDLASDSLEPHPLKTFVNVSSGRLEKDDRLLITSADIFHILPVSEIKKNFQRFEGDKFVQFLKTALSNQMEMVVSIVVEMIEPVPAPITKAVSRKKSARAANAFSGETFAKAPTLETLAPEPDFNSSEENEAQPEHVIETTGPIYVQGDANDRQESSHAQMGLYWDIVKEKISQGSYVTKNEIRRRFSLYKKQLAKKKELRRIEKEKQQLLQAEENKRLEEERVLEEIQQQQLREQEQELERIRLQEENELKKIELGEQNKREQLRLAKEKIQQKELARKNAEIAKKQQLQASQSETLIDSAKIEEESATTPQSRFLEKLRLARLEQQSNEAIEMDSKNDNEPEPAKEADFEFEIKRQPRHASEDEAQEKVYVSEKIRSAALLFSEQAISLSKRILASAKNITDKMPSKEKALETEKNSRLDLTPHFSKIKNLYSHFSTKQKLYTVGALALIFILPIFIVRYLDKPKQPIVATQQTAIPTQAEILSNEKNIKLNTAAQNILSNQNIIASLMANDNPTVVTKTNVIVLQNNQPKEFPLPTDSGTPTGATYMKDLSLVLIFTASNKVISFSPISTKFTDNNISLENISSTSLIGTYLTYLYILDQKNNQVYRFPRADGGFGERTSWLKDSTPLAGVSGITIDDNIYAIQDNQLIKLFKGQKQSFSLEASNTPVVLEKVYTTPDLQSIYALDKQNSRVIAYGKDGKIIAQYFNEALKDGSSLVVDETNNIAYITTPSGLISLSIQ